MLIESLADSNNKQHRHLLNKQVPVLLYRSYAIKLHGIDILSEYPEPIT